MKIAFHYTFTSLFKSIVGWSGAIIPGYARICNAERDTRFVWFSLDQQWEPASNVAACSGIDTFHDLRDLACPGGQWDVMRVGVDASILTPWDDGLISCGVSGSTLLNYAESGRHCGSDPENWMVHIGEVLVCKWWCVDQWDGDAWSPPPVSQGRRYWWSAPEEGTDQREGDVQW